MLSNSKARALDIRNRSFFSSYGRVKGWPSSDKYALSLRPSSDMFEKKR